MARRHSISICCHLQQASSHRLLSQNLSQTKPLRLRTSRSGLINGLLRRCAVVAIVVGVAALTASCSRGTAGPEEESSTSPTSAPFDSSDTSADTNEEDAKPDQEDRDAQNGELAGVRDSSPPKETGSDSPGESRETVSRGEPLRYLFSSNTSGVYQIYLSDDETVTQITTGDEFDSWAPRMAPDGSRLVFSRSPVIDRPIVGSAPDNYRSASIWSIQLDGSGERELIAASTFKELGPMNWSPDGQSVTFAAVDPQGNQFQIFSADTTQFRPKKLTSRAGLFLDPAFGPDGSEISYVAFPEDYLGSDTSRLEVFRMQLDELNEERLTFDSFEDGNPSWSPDGRQIAFDTITDENYLFQGKGALRSVSVDDRSIDTVLADGKVNRVPRWSPDGSILFFQQLTQGQDGFSLRSISVQPPGPVLEIGESSAADQIDIDPISISLD